MIGGNSLRFTQRYESINLSRNSNFTPTSTSMSMATPTPVAGSGRKPYPNSGGWSPLTRTLGSIASTLSHPTSSTSTSVSTTEDMTARRSNAANSYVSQRLVHINLYSSSVELIFMLLTMRSLGLLQWFETSLKPLGSTSHWYDCNNCRIDHICYCCD